MKKDDGLIKKTQDTLHDKVVPAAREGLDKGTTYVSGLLKDTGKKAGELVEAAGEKTRDVGKALGERSEKILPDKNDAFKHFRKEADAVGKKAARLKDDLTSQAKDKTEAAVEFTKRKSDRASREVSKAADKVAVKADKAQNGRRTRKKVVRTAAGAVVLAAAAAGAYAYYKKRLEEDEAIKAEFSEKMKKWNELEGDALAEAGSERPMKMKVRPTRVYMLNNNALLGDDIVVNITEPEEAMAEFNPDEVAEPVNTMEEFRRKAGEIAGRTGEKARQVAGTVGGKAKEVYQTAADKAEEAYQTAAEKAEEVYHSAADKAGDLKDQLGENQFEIRDGAKGFGAEDTPRFRNESRDTWQPVEGIVKDVREKTDDMAENTTEDAWRVEEEIAEVPRHTDETVRQEGAAQSPDAGWKQDIEPGTVKADSNVTREADENWKLDPALKDEPGHPDKDGKQLPDDSSGELKENKMETDDGDTTPSDNLWEKEDLGGDTSGSSSDPLGENISWDDDESVLMQRTEELRRKGAEGFRTVKEKVAEAKDFVVDKYHEMKPEEEPETETDFFNEEYHVTIHNRGNKDYFFSPMLIQRYNSQKRMTTPVPAHEDGTTLEQRIIKPGETYTGKLVLKMTLQDDALIMFEDMLMKNSVAILLEEELDDQFLFDESRDLDDDLLFEGIEGDLEDYEFADEDMTALDLDELDIEEAEELDFDLSDDEPTV